MCVGTYRAMVEVICRSNGITQTEAHMDRTYEDRSEARHAYESRQTGFERATAAAVSWIRGRTHEHWIMFMAGLVLGLLLG